MIYKAQWPLSTNEIQPMVLIYPANSGRRDTKDWAFVPATPQTRKHLFKNRYVRVYFRGKLQNGKAIVDEFVRKDEWL